MTFQRMVGLSVVGMCLAGAVAMAGCDDRVLIGNMRPADGLTGYGGSSVVRGGAGGSGAGGNGMGGGGLGAGGSPIGTPSCSTIWTNVYQPNPCGHTSGVAYSPDGTLLATGVMDSQPGVHIWRLSDGALIHALDGIAGTTYDVAFSPDGLTLAAVGQPNMGGVTAMLYDVGSGAIIRTLPTHSGMYSDTVAFSPDGSLIATGGYMGAIEIWRASDGTLVTSIPYPTSVHNVHFSPTGAQMIAGGVDERATIWNVPAGTLAMTLNGIADEMADAAFSPNGKQIAGTSNVANGVRIWDATSGTLLQTMSGHPAYVSSVVWIDDDHLVSGDWQGNVIEWARTSTGSFANAETWFTRGQVLGMAISPDHTRIVAGASAATGIGTIADGFMFLGL